MKKEWKRFGIKVAAWVAAAVAVQLLTILFLDGPLPYVVPGILALGALQIGLLDRTPLPGGGGVMLKRGIALLMVTFAAWLSVGKAEGKIPWQVYSDELLNVARQNSRPVLIEFTRRDCPYCADMERNVFTRGRVAAAAEGFLPLRADLTDMTAPANRALAEKFKVEEFPTIVFIGPDGQERPNLRLIGYENATFFAQRLERAR